ncbi:YpoC family protein [Cytobacillus horneckiae]|uniref:YpoC family protein n=1 Tax=Cytobacillus horneckiae TaxID=549687 RepID=UPI00203C994A|nr:hypothetical protein [Cytobacillus horneckiae]MCM3180186.1 hypothetical protein [Cytobacillus horneckiae]
MTLVINVDHHLSHPLFYREGESLELRELESVTVLPPFKYELAHYANISTLKPWEGTEKFIPLILAEWKNIHAELLHIFEKREKHAASAHMKNGIALFLQFIYWVNGKPVGFTNNNTIDPTLAVAPSNTAERIAFISRRPTLYQSFIQLGELMIEMEKQYAIAALKKRKK